MSSIPTADISAFTANHHDTKARQAAAKHFAESLKTHGCAAVTGHGVPEKLLQTAFSTMRKLFDLPTSEKMKAPHPDGPNPHRGYLATSVEKSGKLGVVHSKSDSEKAFLEKALDWKETYDIGHEDNQNQKNLWLPDDVFPEFKPFMVQLYGRLSAVSGAFLEALVLGMDASEEDCKTLRRIHTPVEISDASYTLLFQESGSGLEFQNRESGEYMPAPPKEGVLYLNIGSLFETYSNGFYPAAMHRVAIPPTEGAQSIIPSRYSIPVSSNLGSEDMVGPIPSRVEADGKAKYETDTYSAIGARFMRAVLAKA